MQWLASHFSVDVDLTTVCNIRTDLQAMKMMSDVVVVVAVVATAPVV